MFMTTGDCALSPELRKRAVRMGAEVRGDYPTESAAINAVMAKLGVGSRETLRKWVRQYQIDSGPCQGRRARSPRRSR
ncbi:hypothetical protein ACWEQ3_40335 [Streptomyces mirabilis]